MVSNCRDTLRSAAEHLEARAGMQSMLDEKQQVWALASAAWGGGPCKGREEPGTLLPQLGRAGATPATVCSQHALACRPRRSTWCSRGPFPRRRQTSATGVGGVSPSVRTA